MQTKLRCILFLLPFFISCTTSRRTNNPARDDGKLEVVFVQVNDVYEIAPISGGRLGGMARVATLKKQLQQKNSNTFLVMAGDFLSPSVYNSLTYNNKRIRGKQMIEAMNAAGMDLAVFGNHEFDITETEIQERINESAFQWISSNTFHKQNGETKPFEKNSSNGFSVFPQTLILSLADGDGTKVKLGIVGITLPFNKADYVDYTEPISTAENLYRRLKDSCDAVIALTHQFVDEDILLAERVPGLAAILGGHEHDMRFEKIGNVFITKAHANAKSAYIVKLIVGSSRVDLQACKLEYSIVSPK